VSIEWFISRNRAATDAVHLLKDAWCARPFGERNDSANSTHREAFVQIARKGHKVVVPALPILAHAARLKVFRIHCQHQPCCFIRDPHIHFLPTDGSEEILLALPHNGPLFHYTWLNQLTQIMLNTIGYPMSPVTTPTSTRPNC